MRRREREEVIGKEGTLPRCGQNNCKTCRPNERGLSPEVITALSVPSLICACANFVLNRAKQTEPVKADHPRCARGSNTSDACVCVCGHGGRGCCYITRRAALAPGKLRCGGGRHVTPFVRVCESESVPYAPDCDVI